MGQDVIGNLPHGDLNIRAVEAQVQRYMMDADFLQCIQVCAKMPHAQSVPQMNRLRRLGRIIGQIDVARLHRGAGRPAGAGETIPPRLKDVRLRRNAAGVGDPAVAIARNPVGVLLAAAGDKEG